MFKRKPKPRAPGSDIASRALGKVQEESQAREEANARFEIGQMAEDAGDEPAAIPEYLASVAAWEAYHQATGHEVPPEPYARLGVLLRRAKDIDAEIAVLEGYMAHAGRDPDARLQDRLRRAYEIGGREPLD